MIDPVPLTPNALPVTRGNAVAVVGVPCVGNAVVVGVPCGTLILVAVARDVVLVIKVWRGVGNAVGWTFLGVIRKLPDCGVLLLISMRGISALRLVDSSSLVGNLSRLSLRVPSIMLLLMMMLLLLKSKGSGYQVEIW